MSHLALQEAPDAAQTLAVDIAHERKHHDYSPSTLQSLAACPGYQGEQGVTNEAAERGTFLHACVETGEVKGCSDDEANVVDSCRAFVAEKLKSLGAGASEVTEEYISVDDRDTTGGYPDKVLVSADKKKAIVIDWKMGQNPVEDTVTNLQGWAYLLGAVRKYAPACAEVEVVFVMPFQGFEGQIDPHTFYAAQFPEMLLTIVTVVAKAKAARAAFAAGKTDFPGLRPSASGCLFCANKYRCTALHRHAIVVGKKYEGLVIPDEINPLLLNDPVKMGQALKFFQVMESLSKAFRSRATEKALNSENWLPEGYIMTTVVRREIVDKKKFWETVKGLDLTEDQFLEAVTFTFGPIEKVVNDRAPRGQKKAAVEELAELLKMNGATEEKEPIAVLRQKSAPKELTT